MRFGFTALIVPLTTFPIASPVREKLSPTGSGELGTIQLEREAEVITAVRTSICFDFICNTVIYIKCVASCYVIKNPLIHSLACILTRASTDSAHGSY